MKGSCLCGAVEYEIDQLVIAIAALVEKLMLPLLHLPPVTDAPLQGQRSVGDLER